MWDRLDDLIETYGEKLLRYAASILCNHHDAQDIVQDVFIAVRKAAFDGENESAWLYKITYNKCMNLIARRRFVFFGLPNSIAAKSKACEAQEDILHALAQLRPRDRALVYGRIYMGYSFDDLAEQMGVSPAALRKRYERAKKKLHDCLAADYGCKEGGLA